MSRENYGKAERFINEVAVVCESDDCLTWPFFTDKIGRARRSPKKGHSNASAEVCRRAHGPKPSPQHVCAHSCGNGHKACVNAKHLSWKTIAENNEDMIRHGTRAVGESCNQGGLTEDAVKYILDDPRRMTQQAFADIFGVTHRTIGHVINRTTWTHIYPSSSHVDGK